jgi:hypothetical protein
MIFLTVVNGGATMSFTVCRQFLNTFSPIRFVADVQDK